MQKTTGRLGLNNQLRMLDFWANRTDGSLQRWLGAPGCPPLAILLLAPALLFLIYGPTLGERGLLALVLLLVGMAAVVVLARRFAPARRVGWLVVGVAWVTAIAVAVIAGTDAREADVGLYQHDLLVILPVLLLFVAVVPPLLARCLVWSYRRRYLTGGPDVLARALRRAELFVRPAPPPVGLGRFVTSLLPTLFHHLLTLLLFPSMVALLVPHPYMWPLTGAAFLLALVVFALGGVDARLNAMLELAERAFLTGGQAVVSLLAIVLAVGRLVDISYLAIILNSASARVIVGYLAAAYVTLWLYEAWAHFALCERLLPLLAAGPNPPATASAVPYPINPAAVATGALAAGRRVQVHGSRFVVVGKYVSDPKSGALAECFESYDKADLFDAVVRRAFPCVDPAKLERRFGLADLRQHILSYFAVLNLLLIGAAWAAWWAASLPDQVAEYQAPAGEADPDLLADDTFDLRPVLFAPAGPGAPRRRVLLVAASGGGTRAALYSASVFRGLNELDALGDTRVFSGVSGGSAAIAHLTLHRDTLVGRAAAGAWDNYTNVMAEPFIEDVLSGAAELRVARGSRLGILLDESFRRRMDPGTPAESPRTFARSDIGLIFNMTLAGDSRLENSQWGPARSVGAGGRLLLTNVRPASAFPSAGFEGAKDQYLTHQLIRGPRVPLTTAAALSANFPPVFSNALVQTQGARYWVTDGGASDNRGVVSALYVLKDALRRERAARAGAAGPPPAKVLVVIAEASGFSMDYSQDRGIGSTFGAAEKYASQLMVEVMDDIRQEYTALGGPKDNLQLHYLPMPLVFRARGGVGTHWMLGSDVTLTDSTPDVNKAETATLSGDTVKNLIIDLHRFKSAPSAVGRSDAERKELDRVRRWIAQDTDHGKAWDRLVDKLGEKR